MSEWQQPPEPDPADASQWGGRGKGSAKAKPNGADQETKLLPLLWARDIKPVLNTQDFVQGLFLRQSAIVVWGPKNCGKTFWFTDLALHIAAGKTWNGKRVEQGGVIYCVLEGGTGFRNRVFAWIKKHCINPETLPFAAIPSTINLLKPDADVVALIDTIKAAAKQIDVPISLTVIDTLARAMPGGSENAPEDMGALVGNMDRIRAETSAAVAFVHHCGKDEARGSRGHTLLPAAVDTEVEVKENNGTRTATVVKQRDLPKGDAFTFELEPVVLGQNQHNEDVTTCLVVPSNADKKISQGLTPSQRQALEVLTALIAAEGKPLPKLPDYPTDETIRTVAETRWRDECDKQRKPSTAPQPKSREKTWRRAFQDLLAANAVVTRDGLVWLPASRDR